MSNEKGFEKLNAGKVTVNLADGDIRALDFIAKQFSETSPNQTELARALCRAGADRVIRGDLKIQQLSKHLKQSPVVPGGVE
jgi:hypothetical protein